MSEVVHVELFNDGVQVWRPVPATCVGHNEFILHGEDECDLEMEQWAFLPGARVRAELQVKSGASDKPEECLIAVEALEGDAYLGEFGIAGSKVVSIDRGQGQLILQLRSNGYGRPRGSVYSITFNNPRDVQERNACGKEIYGLKATIVPGSSRYFSLMETPTSFCVALSADDAVVESLPSGWWRSF